MSRTLSIFHNPRCSKSRNALAYLEDNKDKHNYNVQIILYQKEDLTRQQLQLISDYLGLTEQEESKEPWKVLLRPDAKKLASSWEEAFELLEQDPKHLERPFVVDFENKKAALGRPDLEQVEELVQSV